MRIGSLARSQIKLAALLTAAAASAILPLATFGQSRYASQGSSGTSVNQGPVQALYTAPAEGAMGAGPSRYVDAYGNPMIVPAGYCESCDEPCASYQQCGCGPCGTAPMAQGGFMGPFPMGAGGTDPPIGYDLMEDTGIQGDLVDQRGPHYFDVRAEAVALQRDKTFGPDIIFTKQTAAPNGTTRLQSNQLDYDWTPGFRILGRYDVCPLSVVEFGYTGIFDFESSAFFRDPQGTLFSVFSGFGDGAVFPGVTANGGPAPQTERALQHTISIESDLQSAEISYRRYWLGWIPRVSGTMLAGFRYTKLNEEFVFSSLGETNPQSHNPVNLTRPINGLDYTVDADNNLAGFQTGADMWICLTQGLRIGSEGKVGLYNNHYSVATDIVTTLTTNGVTTPNPTTPPDLSERFRKDQPAFIAEASLDVVADILPSLSIRAGYEVLFINSIVLAGDNFNTGSPYNPGPADNTLGDLRVPFVVDQSDVFYHGAHAGIEYIW